MRWNDHEILLTPGSKLNGFSSGVQGHLRDVPFIGASPFELSLAIKGSNDIHFAPLGIQNKVKIASSWPDPSFRGAFLPTERNISSSGFDADWQVSYYGRNYPQQGSDQRGWAGAGNEMITASLFGVGFVSLVDSYRTVERSTKYGILFITLVFTSFFLFEIRTSLKLHPFQYLLVGAALCVFYLLLLSLSEFTRFPLAYGIAAGASTLLISLYSFTALKSGKNAFLIGAGLGAIYGFLYVILQLQDYSLLFGSIGLFLILAFLMYATRKVDWYVLDRGMGEKA
jgi:inner membrane protein